MSDFASTPGSPSADDVNRIMKEQEEKLLQSKLNRKPFGRPLLQSNRAKNRTYWDSTQEGAFSKSVTPNADDQLTIVGKIQRTKLHARPEYKFEDENFLEMRTERCLLRPIDPASKEDLTMIVELFADADISRHIPGPLTEFTNVDTEEKALAFAKKSRAGFSEFKTGLMTILDKNTNVLLGVTGIYPIVVDKSTKGRVADGVTFDSETMQNAFEISFALLQKAWGKGFATECVLALEDLTIRLSLNKADIFAYIDSKVCRCQHVLQKIGMGKVSDSVSYRGEEGITLFGFQS